MAVRGTHASTQRIRACVAAAARLDWSEQALAAAQRLQTPAANADDWQRAAARLAAWSCWHSAVPAALRPLVERLHCAARERPDLAATLPLAGRVLPAAEPARWESFLASLSVADRRRHGVFFTPAILVDYLVTQCLQLAEDCFGEPIGRISVIDPACGAGCFLRSAAARRDPPQLLGVERQPETCWLAEALMGDSANRRIRWRLHCGDGLELRQPADLPPQALPLVLGNPPFSSFGSPRIPSWLLAAREPASRLERKRNLHDLCLWFLRWADQLVRRHDRGVIGFVMNHSIYEAITHACLRRHLAEHYDLIRVYDLHGNSLKRERCPDGSQDQNVFGIRSGVGLLILVRSAGRGSDHIEHCECWGTATGKLQRLQWETTAGTAWTRLPLQHDHFRFARQPSVPADYRAAPPLTEIFEEYVSGVQSKCDRLLVHFTRRELWERIQRARRGELPDGVDPRWATRLSEVPLRPAQLQPYLVAPFDVRWIVYEPQLLGRSRWRVLRHMLRPNLALVFMRQSTNPGDYDHALVTPFLASDRAFYSGHGAPYLAPLWRYDADGVRLSNIRRGYLEGLGSHAGGTGQAGEIDALAYVYGVMHEPAFRERFREPLRRDFPRIPWPHDRGQWLQRVRRGRRWMDRHVSALCDLVTDQPAESESAARGCLPRWSDSQGGQLAYATGRTARLPRSVWTHTTGGYQVLPRWLKQRRGRSWGEQLDRQFERLVGTLSGDRAALDAPDGLPE